MNDEIKCAIFYEDYLYIVEFENYSEYLSICVNEHDPTIGYKYVSAYRRYFLDIESYKMVCDEIWLDYKYQNPIENWLKEKMCNIFIKMFGV